ncbi:MAG: hypothetical protein AAGH38_02745 [Pseudomonadota bacterium]
MPVYRVREDGLTLYRDGMRSTHVLDKEAMLSEFECLFEVE